jgi:hypothetical protein
MAGSRKSTGTLTQERPGYASTQRASARGASRNMEENRPLRYSPAIYRVLQIASCDYLLPMLSPNAWKVFSLILRQTEGAAVDAVALGWSTLQALTGIDSQENVMLAVEELLGRVPTLDGRTGLPFIFTVSVPEPEMGFRVNWRFLNTLVPERE